MKYACSVLLLAGAVLGFGQTPVRHTKCYSWCMDGFVAPSDQIKAACADHGGEYQGKYTIDSHNNVPGKWRIVIRPGSHPAPAKPVAPSKQTIKGDIYLSGPNAGGFMTGWVDAITGEWHWQCEDQKYSVVPCSALSTKATNDNFATGKLYRPPLNPFDEKQLGEWLTKHCSTNGLREVGKDSKGKPVFAGLSILCD